MSRLLALLAFVIAAFCHGSSSAQELRVREGVSINVRKGPGTHHPVVAKLNAGDKVYQVGKSVQNPEWIYVKDVYSGPVDRGWVHADLVEWTNPIDWSHHAPTPSLMVAGGSGGEIDSVAVGPNRRHVAAISGGRIRIWHYETGELLRVIDPPIALKDLSPGLFFVRDNIIAVELNDDRMTFFNIDSGDVVFVDSFKPAFPLHSFRYGQRKYLAGKRYESEIEYYDNDLSNISSFDTYQFGSKIGYDLKIVNLIKYSEKSFILLDAVNKKNGGEHIAIIIDHDLNIIEKSGFLDEEDRIVGFDAEAKMLLMAKAIKYPEEKIYAIDFKGGEPIELPYARVGCGFASSGSGQVALAEPGGEKLRIVDLVKGKPNKQFRFDFDHICIPYFDGKDILLVGKKLARTGEDRIQRIDASNGNVVQFEVAQQKWYFERFSEINENGIINTYGGASISNNFRSTVRSIDLQNLLEFTPPSRGVEDDEFLASNGTLFVGVEERNERNWPHHRITTVDPGRRAPTVDPLYKGDQRGWVTSPTGDRFLAYSKEDHLVSVDVRDGRRVALDPVKVDEIFLGHRANPQSYDRDAFLRDLTSPWPGDHSAAYDSAGREIALFAKPRDGKDADRHVYRFSAETGKFIAETKSGGRSCADMNWIDDATYICTFSDLSGVSGLAYLDASTHLVRKTVESVLPTYACCSSTSLDRAYLFAATRSGIIAVYDVRLARKVGDIHLYGEGSWMFMTPEGFYAGEGDADAQLRVSLGVERTYPIDRFRDALYRPDLVAEALKGDPEGLVNEAAAQTSLERILRSGAAPEIIIKGEQQGGTVKASGTIKDSGGGIGRIEWRVNGVVQQTGEGKTSDAVELFLAGGDNRIELVAYNKDDTIPGRSEPLTYKLDEGQASLPRLFVLTVGVDEYGLDPLKLKYAAKDAETVASAFEKAGAGLYGEVFVEVLTDGEVTRPVLEAKFRELAKSVRPNDVFVFFSAGHGKTLDGRFFFIPQDFSGTTLASIREQGIGHATWQEWFSLIPAQKSLLLFDSCESGALTETVVGRELRFRAANDFLGNATGRALIAASSGTGVALEGYKDQGVFAWSIMDALSQADKDANGLIDIDELAASIEETVPRIALETFGEKQTPQFKAPMKGFDVVRTMSAQ